jgi:hypothetical protein
MAEDTQAASIEPCYGQCLTKRDELMVRLLAYAKHDNDCRARWYGADCSCGYDALMKELRERTSLGFTR